MRNKYIAVAVFFILLMAAGHIFAYQYLAKEMTRLALDPSPGPEGARQLRLVMQLPILVDMLVITGLIVWVAIWSKGVAEMGDLRRRHVALRKKYERERALADADIRFKLLFECSPLAIFVFDPEGHLLQANPRGVQLLQLEDRALTEITFPELLSPKSALDFEALKQMLDDAGPQALVISMRQARGIEFDARSHLYSFACAAPGAAEEDGEPIVLLLEPLDEMTARETTVDENAPAVLVADDDELIQIVMHNMLARMGYWPLVAKDGLEALDLFEANRERIVAVVLDLQMPRMDGQEASLQIYKMAPQVPILFCSGFGEIPNDAPAEDKNRLISKPFNYEDLKLALETAIRRPPAEHQT